MGHAGARALATLVLAAAAGCGDSDSTAADAALDAAPDTAGDSGAPDAGGGDAGARSDAAAPDDPGPVAVPLPDGPPGIGFDDLQWSATLDRLVVPAGRAGYVGLLDPRSGEVTRLGGLSASDDFAGGHGFGATSAIEAEGLIYAVDRTRVELVQLDPQSGDMLGAVALGGAPDYVRFVAATRELWVTEPTSERFEIFALGDGEPPALEPAGELAVSGGPESLAVAPGGETAFTNTFAGETLRIDTVARTEAARFENGCALSLGLTLDATGERVFVGCGEGRATSIDAADGTVLSSLSAGGGVDNVAYGEELGHLYVNGSSDGELTVAAVSADGQLEELATLATAPSAGSSCVQSDAYGNVWVCDAHAGQLLRIRDVF